AEVESPTPTPTATVAAGESAPSAWKFGLDRFVLRDGRVRFRDLKLEGSEPVELGVDEIAVKEIALSPGVDGEPAHGNVKLALDEGTVDVSAQLKLVEQGFAVTTEVKAERLPLRRARVYIPKVGWHELKGALDLKLTYELETATKNAIHGKLGLHDVEIGIPD